MMATTHALIGVVLALVVAPDGGLLPVAAAGLGGLFPDFDLYAGHRKTLHFPVYFPLAAFFAAGVAALVASPIALAVALFLAAAAIHSVMDIVGGGLELKPWEATSDRAVYNHFSGRWIAPKRWIRYDGAPEDFLLGAAFGVPALLVLAGPEQTVVGVALAISAVYTLLRKTLVPMAEHLVDVLPAELLAYVPERFVEDFR
ncbi:metal-dependent hydrolase [Haloprofundus salinisoli]|uniref:metal-dependent hydrolase n=1 Tax=Haloprofundus salinisoli TaxID=2876193 RepID=UPI001CCD8B7F|nr:metal-dependent hydrolase [Haloprofundus salinisoli]